jgi:hypothetical protein
VRYSPRLGSYDFVLEACNLADPCSITVTRGSSFNQISRKEWKTPLAKRGGKQHGDAGICENSYLIIRSYFNEQRGMASSPIFISPNKIDHFQDVALGPDPALFNMGGVPVHALFSSRLELN